MEMAEYNVDDFKTRGSADDSLLVKFFLKKKPSNDELVDYVDIRIPGSRTGGFSGPATTDHVKRFPKHWAAYKNRTEAPSEGISLFDCPLLTSERADELTFHNIKTVEQLAEISDNNAAKFMGGVSLKRRAIEWLEMVEAKSKIDQMDKLEATNQSLQKQLDELKAQLNRSSLVVPRETLEKEDASDDTEDELETLAPRRRRNTQKVDS